VESNQNVESKLKKRGVQLLKQPKASKNVIDQELAERWCMGDGRRFVFTHQMAALFA